MKLPSPRGSSFEREVHTFLLNNFDGYTVTSGNISGHWKNGAGRDEFGVHREYKVAVPSVAGTRLLEEFLGTLATEMGEKCIYIELGGEVYLICPAARPS